MTLFIRSTEPAGHELSFRQFRIAYRFEKSKTFFKIRRRLSDKISLLFLLMTICCFPFSSFAAVADFNWRTVTVDELDTDPVKFNFKEIQLGGRFKVDSMQNLDDVSFQYIFTDFTGKDIKIRTDQKLADLQNSFYIIRGQVSYESNRIPLITSKSTQIKALKVEQVQGSVKTFTAQHAALSFGDKSNIITKLDSFLLKHHFLVLILFFTVVFSMGIAAIVGVMWLRKPKTIDLSDIYSRHKNEPVTAFRDKFNIQENQDPGPASHQEQATNAPASSPALDTGSSKAVLQSTPAPPQPAGFEEETIFDMSKLQGGTRPPLNSPDISDSPNNPPSSSSNAEDKGEDKKSTGPFSSSGIQSQPEDETIYGSIGFENTALGSEPGGEKGAESVKKKSSSDKSHNEDVKVFFKKDES